MPKTPSTGYYNQAFLWRAAAAHMLISCRCMLCRRMRHYYAMDLLPIFGAKAVIGELWGRCPRCGERELWEEQERYPTNDDVGHLVVRRPAGIRAVQLWEDQYYSPPAYGPPWPPPPGPSSIEARQYGRLNYPVLSVWDRRI